MIVSLLPIGYCCDQSIDLVAFITGNSKVLNEQKFVSDRLKDTVKVLK